MVRIILGLILVLFIFPLQIQTFGKMKKQRLHRDNPVGPLVVVAFGDSTTAPRGPLRTYAILLQERLGGESNGVRVVNAGIPGNNTQQARDRIDRDVIAQHPKFVTIFFGINDSAVDVPQGATEPRIPLTEYEENLTWIVQRLQSRGIRPILMTPNPVAWTEELKKYYGKSPYLPDDPDGWNVLLKDYAGAVRHVAKKRKLPLIDVYDIFQKYAGAPGHDLNDLMLDGMHPNDLGHSMIAHELLKIIKR